MSPTIPCPISSTHAGMGAEDTPFRFPDRLSPPLALLRGHVEMFNLCGEAGGGPGAAVD